MKENGIIVLGLGNILCEDEGFGVHFIREFAERHRFPEHVALLDGGVLGYNLLDTITNCDQLVVIDVLKVDDDPGSIYRFDQREMEQRMPEPTSAHEVEFFDVVCAAELMDQCPEVTYCCIVPVGMTEMKLTMSAEMTGKMPVMEELVLKELARLGVQPLEDAPCTK